MRRAVLLAALLASGAQAQVLTPGDSGPFAGTTSSVAARYPFDRIGVPIPHDIAGLSAPQVVQHLVWNGTAVVDLAASPAVLTMQGTVPMVSGAAGSTPWFPNGFASTGKPGAGPFSGANYYTLPADSVYDTTGDFIVCAVLDGNPATGVSQRIVSDYVTATSGWRLIVNTTGTMSMNFQSPTAVTSNSTAGVNGLNVVCGGRASTTSWVKANLGAADTDALPTQVASTTTVGRVGVDVDGTAPLTMMLRELIFWRGATPTDTVLTMIQHHVFGHHGTRGPVYQPVTFTRSTTTSCPLPYEGQTSYLVPVNVPCITGGTNGLNGGLRIEPARTNYALNSATNPKTGESSAALSTGAHVAYHLGAGTLTVTAGTATVTGLSCTAVAAGTVCPFTVTGAGTVLITTSGAATHVQVENGAYRTSMIATAGTAVARSADIATVATAAPLAPTNTWCLTSTITPLYARALNVASAEAWSWGPAGNNSAAAVFGTASFVLTQTDNAGGVKTYTTAAADTSTIAGTYTGCMDAAAARWFKYSSPVAGTAAGAGTGTWTSPTTLYLGSNNSAGSELGGYLRQVKLCPRSGKPGLCR